MNEQTLIISKSQARAAALKAQLLTPDTARKAHSVAEVLAHIGYVQIDTLSVVARAQHHVLWTRLPDYRLLDLAYALEEEKSIFEYWSHAAAYLPMVDYAYTLPNKHRLASGEMHWFSRDLPLMEAVLARIREQGPMRAKDFEVSRRRGQSGWWEWKPAKKALEQLFMEGKLMVARREKFQKCYDLPEHVLPKDVERGVPSKAEFARYLILKVLQAHAFASLEEVCYQRRGIKTEVKQEIQQMREEGLLIPVQIEGVEKYQAYTLAKYAFSDALSSAAYILSPFDNVLIQRKRLQRVFDYAYQIECYVPKPKRRFGYFCLPILWRDRFVGRLDAKAYRKTKELEIISLFIEHQPEQEAAFLEHFAHRLLDYMEFNACESLQWGFITRGWSRKIKSVVRAVEKLR